MARSRLFKFTRNALVLSAVVSIGAGVYVNRDEIMRLIPAKVEEVVVRERPAQPVRVTRVTYRQPLAQTVYTGTIRPRLETSLGFRVGGKLLVRLVSVGDKVKLGQTLARLDDTDVKLELESVEAELIAAQTELKRAQAEAERNRKLLAKGYASRAAYDRAAATQAEAQSRVERALRSRNLTANRLDYVKLKADQDGVVTAELAEPGAVLQVGQPVVSVARFDAFDVVFALPEQNLEKLRGDATAVGRILDNSTSDYQLALRDVSPDVDPATRTYRVRMGIVEPDAKVSFGRTVSITFAAPFEKQTASLPLAAVLNDGRGAFVWRLLPDNQKVERVPVKVEAVDGNSVMIREGLSDGDTVISLGSHKIDPDRPVKVVEMTTTVLN
jgi:RND family efflux transporter MFP subunit